jgi:ribonuclease T1
MRKAVLPRLIFLRYALLALLVALCCTVTACARGNADSLGTVSLADLPPEAITTLRLIDQGGPFPYRRDGIVFGNYERRLPIRQRGYYHEYTVPTPAAGNRGARRIVTGNGGERYYTNDHYQTFRRIKQ